MVNVFICVFVFQALLDSTGVGRYVVSIVGNLDWCVSKLVKLSVNVLTKTGKYIGTWECRHGPVVTGCKL